MDAPPNYNHFAKTPIIVENVPVFRRAQEQRALYSIPEATQNRKLTDVPFLIVLAICIIVQVCLMIYALVNSDILRLVNGYDTCGNVCGVNNKEVEGIPCSGQDMTEKPYLIKDYGFYTDIIHRRCVASCDNYLGEPISKNRCQIMDPSGFFENTVRKIGNEGVNLTVMCIVGLVLSLLALVLFRFFIKQFVWTMLGLSVLGMFALDGFLWYVYTTHSTYLGLAIVFTLISIIFTICLLVLIPKINLVIQFFKQAADAVFFMPLILLEPILTFIADFIVIALFVYLGLLMSTSGTLKVKGYYEIYDHIYDYQADGAMNAAFYFSIIMMIWMLQFILACQQMVISGAISAYYFSLDKLTLVSPIFNSFYNLVRFHLGSVAFGSFLITVIRIIHVAIKSMASNRNFYIFYICLRPLEEFLKYLTSMGYIEVAIHGQPLCRSCMRAFNLIIYNFLSSIAMNNIGSFVFFMVKLLVVILTVCVGILMKADDDVVVIVLGAIVAFFCVHCFFVVFETAVDTVFICYCEDQCINDGDQKPYCASVDLHNQIKKAQVVAINLERQKFQKQQKRKIKKSEVVHN